LDLLGQEDLEDHLECLENLENLVQLDNLASQVQVGLLENEESVEDLVFREHLEVLVWLVCLDLKDKGVSVVHRVFRAEQVHLASLAMMEDLDHKDKVVREGLLDLQVLLVLLGH